MKSIRQMAAASQILFVGLAMGVAGCATTNMALQDARINYNEAASDPSVVKDAAVALHEAKITLDKAEALSKDRSNQEEVTHLAYVVNQKVETAKATALQQRQKYRLGTAAEDRNKIVLDARGREVEASKKQAAASRAKAEESAAEAEASENRAQEAELASRESRNELDQSIQREAGLSQELAALKAKETEVGTQLTLRDMMFETGKSQLTSGGSRDVGKIAGIAKQNPKRAIVVEGHTDSVGTEAYNMELSRRRAQAVQNLLVQDGVPVGNITLRALGETFPVAANDTRSGRQLNRRVVVTILHEGKNASDLSSSADKM